MIDKRDILKQNEFFEYELRELRKEIKPILEKIKELEFNIKRNEEVLEVLK